MLEMSTQLPIPPTIPDNQELQDYLTAVKQYCEEITRKAKQVQMEIRTSVPTTDDLIEGEDVRYNTGGVRRTYTLLDGEIRVHTET